jgi:hypothetical protein
MKDHNIEDVDVEEVTPNLKIYSVNSDIRPTEDGMYAIDCTVLQEGESNLKTTTIFLDEMSFAQHILAIGETLPLAAYISFDNIGPHIALVNSDEDGAPDGVLLN